MEIERLRYHGKVDSESSDHLISDCEFVVIRVYLASAYMHIVHNLDFKMLYIYTYIMLEVK